MSIPINRGMASVGAYQVVADLGAAPWGTAYAAIDGRSEREVLLQIVPLSRRGTDEGDIPWEVLLAETAALARVYHPGIPDLVEIAEEEGDLLVASVALPGSTLDEALETGPWPDRTLLVDWGCQLLDILAEAHRQGLLHRHLGEGEVIVGPDGGLTITGFGLTRRSFEPLAAIPPEVRAGLPATRRSDLYAVGVILRRIARGARLAPDDPLFWVLARATALDPAGRFESAAQMAAALRRAGRGNDEEERALRPEPREAPATCGEKDRRSALLLLAAALLLLLSLLTTGWLLLGGSAQSDSVQKARATSARMSRQTGTSAVRTYSSIP